MTLPLPGASLSVEENGLGLIASPPTDIAVVIGVCSDGPVGTSALSAGSFISTPYSFGNLADLVSGRGCGPGVKAAAYMHAKTGSPFVYIRVPKTARAATKSAVDISDITEPTLAPALTGTPNDSYEVIVEFTLGGTTGTGPITYRYSLDGGETWSSPISLGTALTLAALATATGVTVTLVTAKAITTGDSLSFSTTAASASIQPVSMDFDGASTSIVTATGTPEDAYDVEVEVLESGTIGTAGIVLRYSLDGGRNWTNPVALGTATSLQLNEYALAGGTEDTGVDLAFAAGDLTTGDIVTFTTTAPEAQDSDIVAALVALKASDLGWSFIHIVGQSNATTAGSVQSQLATMAGAAAYSWAALSARDRAKNELDETWRAALVANVADLGASRISIGAGYRRITCPVTGRRNRRPAMWIVVPRVIARPMQEDPGRVATGAISADVEIANDDDFYEEHDARLNPDLHGARYVTLRTYEELDGLYITQGNMMATEGTDVSLIPLRRVLDVGSLVFRRAMILQLGNGIFVNPATYPVAERRGCIRETDALTIERELRTALEDALTAEGRASGVTVSVSRTDLLLTNGGRITATCRITPLGYVRSFVASIAFEDPRLTELQAA